MKGRIKGSIKVPGSGRKVLSEEDRAISRTITLKKKYWEKLIKLSKKKQ